MNMPWIRSYGAEHPAGDRRRRLSLGRRALRRRGRALRRPAGLRVLRPHHELRRDRPRLARRRRLAAAGARREARRPDRADVPERLRLPDRHARHPARRRGAGERQPALHPARARAPAERRGRRDHRHLRRLDPDAGRDHRPDAGQDRGHPRPRRRQRPRHPLAGGRPAARGRHQARRRARRRARRCPSSRSSSAATTSCSSSTPAAPPASRRARCSPTATSSPTPSSSRRSCPRRPRPGEEVLVLALPLYHIFGLMMMLAYATIGARAMLIPNPRDMDGFIDAIKDAKLSVLPGGQHPLPGADHASAVQGDRPLELQDRHRRRLRGDQGDVGEVEGADRPPRQGGLRPLRDFADPLPEPDRRSRVLGRLRPAAALDRDRAPRRRGPRGRRGRGRRDLRPRAAGDAAATGTTSRPTPPPSPARASSAPATSAIFTEDGFVKIVDRKKDMILVSGFNVYPNEVEATVTACDGIAECACIGVPTRRPARRCASTR